MVSISGALLMAPVFLGHFVIWGEIKLKQKMLDIASLAVQIEANKGMSSKFSVTF